ncbi:hypothetical protein A2480_03405 [Candidatus Uhrbacteria bacterium RIFOXYC2_FULL_47_19]|uniref:Uncharacterized protein n=1 Tax=Candidatus Uhrbacteria bacterium RIFOXYC2_FULL_47_19 TaxID=1802424 RepID=A0A1F7WFV6_9BACT|nr:MAG: hypothetical protein A2480_03405 [Candidatus Uhrbacteria bacterium RIFOXYC2_FULL_47_19]HCC22075.1 hypothetical protein [Candidatus Uhrbacteria bacterium]
MKQIKSWHRLLAIAITIVGLGSGIVGVGTALAYQQPHIGNGMNGLVEALAVKFNLNTADVQAVFDEQHAQIQTNREVNEAERLSQAVTDGKLTQEQADAVTAKREEIRSFMESLSTLDESARRDALKTKQDELKKWAEDNGISMPFFRGGLFGGRMFGGMGHGGHSFGGFRTNDVR